MMDGTDTLKRDDAILARDEQFRMLRELQEKRNALSVIITEGEIADSFIQAHPFHPILERTLRSMRDAFNADAHKAAKDSRAEIANYLGREEGITSCLNLIPMFVERSKQAMQERDTIDEQIKELQEILGSPERETVDTGGAMG